MSDLTLSELQEQLALKQGELNIIMAIDHIRDTAADPPAMLTAIVDLLTQEFQLDGCILFLHHQEQGHLVLQKQKLTNPALLPLSPTELQQLAESTHHLKDVTLWPEPIHNAHVAIMPIIIDTPKVAEKRLGVGLLCRLEPAFSPIEILLMIAAESQVDSAIIQCYVDYELRQRNKELETIYRIDHVRDQHLSFDQMLHIVLMELLNVIPAQIGFIMLHQPNTDHLHLQAFYPSDLPQHIDSTIIEQLAQETFAQTEIICYDHYQPNLRAVLAMPLDVKGVRIGVLGLADRQNPFTTEDWRLLKAVTSQIDTAIFEDREHKRMRTLLSRSVGQKVLKRMLSNPDVGMLKPERALVTVLFADLVGSTGLAEKTEPEILVGFINDFLKTATETVYKHEGMLDKFVGDMVMALFNVPYIQPDHALRAVRAALEMHSAHQKVLTRWAAYGISPHPMTIGIATGELTVGEMGFEQRSNYTVIGNAANLGARLCSKALSTQTLIDPTTYEMVKNHVIVTPYQNVTLKGIAGAVTVYDVHGVLDEE